jgi:hypothetical protein
MEDVVDDMLTPNPGTLERDFNGDVPRQEHILHHQG